MNLQGIKAIQKKYQKGHLLTFNIITYTEIVHSMLKVPLYPCLLSRCPVLATQEAADDVQVCALVCFGARAVHNDNIQQ